MLAKRLNAAQNKDARVSRRAVLVGGAALGGGLAIGYALRSERPTAVAAEPAGPAGPGKTPQNVSGTSAAADPFAAYVTITSANKVIVHSSQFEMGQGAYNGVATLLAEELEADWSQIDVEGASGNTTLYGNILWGGEVQGTGGSTSMATSFDRYRKAGAAAKAMLIAAAAAEWNVPAAEVSAKLGKLSHASGKEATFGEMAAKAATMPLPTEITLKPKAEWTLIGNEKLKRFDSGVKARGQQEFTIDVKLDGLLVAVPIHPPKFGGKVKSFDASAAKQVKGVVDVVETPRGLSVVAQNTWAAIKGREAVTVTWDESAAEARSSTSLAAEYREHAKKAPVAVARTEGDIKKGFAGAAKVIEATYEFPYLAHAAMEPMNAVARMSADGTLEVWGGHQIPDLYQAIAAQVAGVDPAKVKMHIMKTGGGFGRRAVGDGDIIVEAVATAKAIGWKAPVRLQWTREDDTRGGRYRPMYVHRLRGGLDKDGNIIAWENHIVGQSIVAGTPFEGLVQNGVDGTSVEGAANIPYKIPNIEVGLTSTKVGVPVLWWRAVGSTHTAYAVETFLDELAEAAGKDPVAFRLAMLADHPRHAAVLKLAAEKAGWGTPAPDGRFRGIALAESFNTFVAQVAEVSLKPDGTVKVERVVCAVDCGTIVNPDQVRSQIEGGVGFGVGSILRSELTLTNGEVDQGNYDTFEVLRLEEMPVVEAYWVESDAAPTGIGEPGVPPVGPAIANAIYQATKKRIYQPPFAKAGVV